ncbi:uncharacterized protein (DUF2267 family) [Anseongella ginsenosidimutans]|uniref:Uncharacterized protein (DUF2267 family) n=1 Tax=Anseongella ginsenosidimutans TaxID=496056 RepID=A0A4R3KQ53_9SPHI|nr:DUF2267 domain-containing protein [Anseongella ginsenosidimutans]QEC53895.1 DUF2267 domain-containing protein [Anseongella ginsenosidimutans]TCS86277.1 uncharacterized protein (DUF2267 family) [Anseongella ginsenosidimutans]
MTTNQALNFDKYAQEGNLFMHELGEMLNHPGEQDRAQAGRLLRAVLHTLREHISVGQSLNLIAQFPMFLKAIYVDQWKLSADRERIKTMEEFTGEVENKQREEGEVNFDWNEPTSTLVEKVLISLGKYVSAGELSDVEAELPGEIRRFLQERVGGE